MNRTWFDYVIESTLVVIAITAMYEATKILIRLNT